MRNHNPTNNYPDVDDDDVNFDLGGFGDNQDREYSHLLPNRKSASKNSYFMKNEKYRGTTNPQSLENDDSDQ